MLELSLLEFDVNKSESFNVPCFEISRVQWHVCTNVKLTRGHVNVVLLPSVV